MQKGRARDIKEKRKEFNVGFGMERARDWKRKNPKFFPLLTRREKQKRSRSFAKGGTKKKSRSQKREK